MIKLFPILALLVTSYCGMSQGFFKKKNQIRINYTYSYIYNGRDTIKCLRLSQEVWKKLSEIDQDIRTRGQNVESFLQQRKSGIYDLDENHFAVNIQHLDELLKQNRIQFEISDYRNEFNYYKKHPVKTQDEIRKEMIAKAFQESDAERERENEKKIKLQEYNRKIGLRNDSIVLVNKRQQAINDSIAEVNERNELVREKRNQQIRDQKLKMEQQAKAEKERLRRIAIVAKYGDQTGELIINRKVKVGWTKEMCLESWGKPREINRTTTASVVHEQWVYSLKKYLYFDNEILSVIQD